MDLDVLFLSRFQFALTIMFHYLFPPLSIGLGVIMAITEGMYIKTKNRDYEIMARFWTKVFAVVFAMGVATGIVMEFQFGTNWATYSRYVGDVFGSPLAAEGIFAFFLESGFLAILVFGWDRVSPRVHFFSTIMVALGSMFSAVWIVVANSWMQTPTGFHIVGEGMTARAEITDFWAMVFNPSSVDRLVHTLIGAFILGAFFVMSITAWYILHRRHERLAKQSFTIALVFGTIASLAALVTGHEQANTVSRTQPAKLAAFEGHFTTGPADMWLFGIPDEQREMVNYGIAIPGGLSFLLHQDFDAPVTGLDQFPPEDRPPLQIPFQMYHIMITLGMYFIALTLFASFLRWRGTLFEKRWLMWVFVVSVLGPYIANQAGWIAAEVGRQPWIVYGLLRTSDALSKAVTAEEVLASIILFTIIYLFLLAVWLYVMNDKIKHGPDDVALEGADGGKTGLLDTISSLADHAGPSMTDARKGKEKK
ncbi:MAG: cytochrome ubiquinol oxidase subunit I [Bacteroidota bacterium]|jgi:cytochrome d ubiquinol oxidase subunit I|nr:cytochrome ubiquinol oxidase subunit I [Bacteroidota bacterium]